MVDKVRPLKLEDTGSGTELDLIPTETNPLEDYLASKGVAFEGSDDFLIWKDGNDIKLKDSVAGTFSLNQLRTASYNSFDNTSNGFTATNVQSAIEESRSTAIDHIRIPDVAGYQGVASNRWLERGFGNSSRDSPLVIVETRYLATLALTASVASVGTVTVYKSPRSLTPVSIATISLVADIKAHTTGLSVLLQAGDEVGYRVTSGAITQPCLTAEYQQDS